MLQPLAALLLAWSLSPFAGFGQQPARSPDRPSVVWRDAETHDVLFSVGDVVRFDWSRQRFELTRERAMALMAIDMGLSRRFTVEDEHGVIYTGTLVGSASSGSYDGPAIELGGTSPVPPVYDVRESYHGRPGREDQRFAPRLRTALEHAAVLSTIERPADTAPIRFTLAHEWLRLTRDLRVLVTIFPETFAAGANGRVHVMFLTDEGFDRRFDRVGVQMQLTSERGEPLVSRDILSLESGALPKAGFPMRKTHVCTPVLEGLPAIPQGTRIAFRYTLVGGELKSPEVIQSEPVAIEVVR